MTLVNRAELAARPVPEGLLHWSQRQSEPAFGAVGATGNSMNANHTTTPLDDEQPLNVFADCHKGIVTQLNTLGELPALLASLAEASC